jgi:2',3'-cyclic-nucleotide 2'-phosphodiesterase/3'-nucleotidase
VALNNAADLYLYPNALHAVKMDGAAQGLAGKSAERFNRIDPASRRAGAGQHRFPASTSTC